MVDPAKRVVINELVCEGCGDCWRAVQLPQRGAAGHRVRSASAPSTRALATRIIRASKGFCPSFVTVEGGQLKKKPKAKRPVQPVALQSLPEPVFALPLCRRTRSGALWWRAWAEPASSPSASCWARRRISRAKASSPRTRAVWPRKGGATWSHVLIADSQEQIIARPAWHGRSRPDHRLRPARDCSPRRPH
jgi:indolepyruvate ferredoxin oxidoreductase